MLTPWSDAVGVLLSPLENPQYFANFSQAVPFFSVSSMGAFCLPVDFSAANIDGVKDGANVTIQLEYDGGDGILLFQVSDSPERLCCNMALQVLIMSKPAVRRPHAEQRRFYRQVRSVRERYGWRCPRAVVDSRVPDWWRAPQCDIERSSGRHVVQCGVDSRSHRALRVVRSRRGRRLAVLIGSCGRCTDDLSVVVQCRYSALGLPHFSASSEDVCASRKACRRDLRLPHIAYTCLKAVKPALGICRGSAGGAR